MPNIVQYEAPTTGLQPSEIGVEAAAQTGRYVSRFYNQWGESLRDFGNRTGSELGRSVIDAGDAAVKFQEHREISHGAAAFAGLNDQLTQSWNDTAKNADPNDPTVAASFREKQIEPSLDKFREGFLTEGGQHWAEQRIDALRNHMFEKTAADMSSLASVAVSNNVHQMMNTMSNTAMNDPSAVDHLIDSVHASVGGLVDSSPNIRGVDAAKAKTEVAEKAIEHIVKSGAIGAIQKSSDPEATADEWGKRYPQYISGDELKTLGANARAQIRARNYDYEMTRRRNKEIADDRSGAAADQYLIDIRSQDPKLANDPTAQKVLNDPNLTRKDKGNLLNYIDRQAKPETEQRISSQTTVDLLRQFRQPDADMDQIMDAAWKARLTDPGKPGSLTERDFNTVRTEIAARKTPDGEALAKDRDEFFKRYAASIDSGMALGEHSALGSQQIYKAQMDARREEAAMRKAGKDPHSLYDPSSPDFFGKRLSNYQISLKQVQDYDSDIREGKTSAPVEIPAEMSPADAIRRYGGRRVRLPDGRIMTLPTR